MKLVLYSKENCCLCEGLIVKLQQVKSPSFQLEIREINSNPHWVELYQYEVPVLCILKEDQAGQIEEQELPRVAPRSPVSELAELLQRYI
ncbi:MAG: glutaredoxin family protein [Pseudanabaenaceae cyanobacterium bins.39]|nr:glutaredoxin family protein [Pseudanabaenaceae cyanobacterium bins.39]